jgi:uncharacterized protein
VQVRFDEIPAEGREFEIKDVSWFPEGEVEPMGPFRARIMLERREDRVFLQGMLAGRVRLTCDRCLEEYEFGLDHEFRIDLELVDQEELSQFVDAEHACQDSEMDVMFLDEPLVDLGEILAQQVLLTLPAKRLCDEACKGLCPRCGVNRNHGSCDCDDSANSSPFAMLKKLKH